EGVDGRIYFETQQGLRSMVISVKGGHVNPAQIRELVGTLAHQSTTELAGFICLEKPTKGMIQEATRGGMFTYQGVQYPRVQIRSVEELLDERAFETPSRVKTLGWQKQTQLAI
ncbi:MAG TPA: hypothetical protein VGQ24_13295, partial [Gemmatimonadales bacterium]|nr:hypothetical protein [Gemmatimonadales bacterium]